MKILVSLILVCFSLVSCMSSQSKETKRAVSSTEDSPKALMLEYSSGFQAGWSWVKVYYDGSVEHQERICCPPHNSEVSESPVRPEDLSRLVDAVEEVERGTLVTKKNVKLGLGQKVGTLFVYAADGKKLTVENVARSATGVGSTTINNSRSSSQIISFVRKYAKNIILE